MDFQDTVPTDGRPRQRGHEVPRDPPPVSAMPAFVDTMPGTPGNSTDTNADARTSTHTQAGASTTLPIQFTGSGSEYFRIWIVNLLLTLVTLTLYLPYARARRLRYFHGNTLVGGHALGFHGDPRKMLRGHLLVLLLTVAYGAAVRLHPTAGAVAVVIFASIWPALWCASLRFRLANTSWRGLRFGFAGGAGGAYRAMSPVLVPVAVFMIASLLGQPEQASEAAGPSDGAKAPEPPMAAVLALLAAMLVGVLLTPMSLAWIKRYQHGHYTYAGEQTGITLRTSAVYGAAIVAMLIGMLAAGALTLIGVVGAVALPKGPVLIGTMIVLMVLFYAALFFLVQPYFTAQLQNLAWNATRSAQVRFESRLRTKALATLTLRNLLLTLATLGLYRPFAAINTAKLRLEAVQLQVQGDVEQWHGRAQASHDATGDAAGDLLGVDLGL